MEAYHELYVYAMGRRDFMLQHVVDANIAQTAPANNPPPIGVIFALIGLYLHVEMGFTGTEVQKAHKLLARFKRSWPSVVWPNERGNMTAQTVLATPAGPERDQAIHQWCRSVWGAFSANRTLLASLLVAYKIL